MQQLVTEELRPRPGRVRTAVRMAFIAAVGIALMAALHIDSALGPVTLWVALYASSSVMTPSEGLIMIVTYAVTLIASVFLAGVLVDAPWMLLPFFGLATALMTYWLNKQGLVGAWFNVVVGFLDTFYLCVFDPQNFGWSVAYTFSGIALAIGVLVAFDMVLWPDPAERRLLRSLADTLDRDASDWPQSVALMLIHSPQLCCLRPPLFRYCPRTFLYWNAPDASSIIQSAKLSCWPQSRQPSAFTSRSNDCWRSRAITSHETSARFCGPRWKQCSRPSLQRFGSRPTKRPRG